MQHFWKHSIITKILFIISIYIDATNRKDQFVMYNSIILYLFNFSVQRGITIHNCKVKHKLWIEFRGLFVLYNIFCCIDQMTQWAHSEGIETIFFYRKAIRLELFPSICGIYPVVGYIGFEMLPYELRDASLATKRLRT